MGFGDAVASAGPYAICICTSLQIDNHTNTSSLNFLQAGCSSWHPNNSVSALIDCFTSVYFSFQCSDTVCWMTVDQKGIRSVKNLLQLLE